MESLRCFDQRCQLDLFSVGTPYAIRLICIATVCANTHSQTPKRGNGAAGGASTRVYSLQEVSLAVPEQPPRVVRGARTGGKREAAAPGPVSCLLVLRRGTVLSWPLPFPDTGSALGMLGSAGGDLKLIFCFLVVLGDAEHVIFSLIKLTISR